MKRFLVFAAVVMLILSGCQKKEETPSYPVEEFSIEFNERPKSVLCLDASSEELLRVLGYGHSILDKEDAFEDEDYPSAGEIISLSPDLVIFPPDQRKELSDALGEKGIPYISVPRFKDDDELLNFAKSFSVIFDGNNDSVLHKEQLDFYFQKTDEALRNESGRLMEENFDGPPTFLFLTGENFALTPDTLLGDYFSSLGFINAAEEGENYCYPLSLLGETEPDVLIYPSHLENIEERIPALIYVPYEYEKVLYQGISSLNFRKELLEEIFGQEIEIEDNFLMLPEETEEENEDTRKEGIKED